MKSSLERLFRLMDGEDPCKVCEEYYMRPSLAERLFKKMNECTGTSPSVYLENTDGSMVRLKQGATYAENYGKTKWSEENITGPEKEDLKWLFEEMSK